MYKLRLFIAGTESPTSKRAIEDVKTLFEKYLSDLYSFSIIDVLDNPDISRKQNIFATPVLIRSYKNHDRRVFGNLSNPKKVLEKLGIVLTIRKR